MISNRIGFNKGIGLCFQASGLAYYNLGKFDTALFCFEKQLGIVTEMKDKKGIASALDNMAIINMHFGKMDMALSMRKKSMEIYSSLNEKTLLANCYTWIGNINKDQGEYAIALENYIEALKIFDAEKDDKDIGYPLINISSIYRFLKQYEKAKKYALDAKLKFEKDNNQDGIGISLYRLAIINTEELEYDNAIRNLTEAQKVFTKTQNNYFLTLVNLLFGTCYQKKGDIQNALNHYNDALYAAQQIGDVDLIASVLQNIGTIYFNNGDYLKALEYMLKVEKKLTEINNRKGIMENLPNFIEIYSRLNQPDSVIKYFQIYQILSNTIFNEQNSSAIAEMQTKYETAKKEREIITLNLENEKKGNNILQLNNINEISRLKIQNSSIENLKNSQALTLSLAERERQNSKIEILKLEELNQAQVIQEEKNKKKFIALTFSIGIIVFALIFVLAFLSYVNKKKKEKAILNQQAAELSRQVSENDMKALRAQMNPHFIFNCMHTIERLLKDSKIIESKICLAKFSNLTRSVLENSKKKEIPLSEEIETLILYMELENLRFRNPFTYNFLIAPDVDIKTTLIPPLILQPFIENSIKHGFRETDKTGHLTIALQIVNELLICIIEDNGIGRKASTIKPLSGFKKESMGIKLTEERLQLISKTKNNKAYFLIDDLTDNLNNPIGTRVKMFLPYEITI